MKKFFTIIAILAVLAPNVAQAAISFVSGACEGSSTNGGDVVLTLPTALENDLVIVAYSNGDADNVNENVAMITTGYTEVADLFSDDTFETNFGAYWKVMGATPDTSATVDGVGGADTAVAAVCMVFRGVDTTTPMDVTPTTATALDTFSPNPPSIDHLNPSGVWTVIAGGSGHGLNVTTVTYTFPTGYTTDARDIGQIDTSDTTAGMGYRSSGVLDPEDPGVMTHSGTDAATYAWAAVTIALRPAVTVAPTVTTNAGTSVTVSGATLNGNITATGGSNATVRGFAWGTNSGLSAGDTGTTTESGSFGTGTFSQGISNILSNTTYSFRAYATNPAGTGYGSILSFTTGTDTTPTRKMRLFEGFRIKLINGRVILHQR